ncbi:MAG TPA: hypothetical protein VI357_02790 [Mycobacteriales bacterium]
MTEDGDNVSGSQPDGAPVSPPADTPSRSAPRIARRRPSTGPVLPDVTSDEQDVGWGDRPDPDDDERLLREVPPHHGG